MNINGISGAYLAAYQYANKTQKAAESEFAQKAEETAASNVEAYKARLEARFGAITVKSVGKDQKSMDALGASTYGTGNVVIAPNILEEMANDPKKAAYYESKIQWHFDSLPRLEAQLSAAGHEIHSCGIVIHEDGTVTRYVSGDLKPEVRARIEAQIKKEQEAKAERRRAYAELREEAAEKRRLELKDMLYYQVLGNSSLASSDVQMYFSGGVMSGIGAYANSLMGL